MNTQDTAHKHPYAYIPTAWAVLFVLFGLVACGTDKAATPTPIVASPTAQITQFPSPPSPTDTPITSTPFPTREWNLEDIQVDGSTVTVSLRVFAGIDVRATLDGKPADEVRPTLPTIEYVFWNVIPGKYTVEVRDVVGHSETTEVVVPTFPTSTSTPSPTEVSAIQDWVSYPSLNDIRSLAFASDGSLWAGTGSGVVRWDLATDTHIRYSTADGLASDDITDLAFAPDGTLWIAARGGVSHFDGTGWSSYTEADGLISDIVYAIAVAPDGSVWMGTQNGASHLNGAAWASYTMADGLADNVVWYVAVAADEDVWFSTHSGGVSRYNTDQNTWTTYSTEHGLPLPNARFLTIGPDGAPWLHIGYDHVYRFDGTNWQVVYETGGSQWVCDIAFDADELPWIATCGGYHAYGAGLAHFDGKNWMHTSITDGLIDNDITAVAVSPGGIVAAGTDRGLSVYQAGRWHTLRSGPTLSQVTTVTVIHPMKGYELYSWQEGEDWYFALVVGTNRIKTFDEIAAPEVRVRGIEALEVQLDQLASGEQVFWSAQRVPHTALPPDDVIEQVQAYCEQRGIELEIEPSTCSGPNAFPMEEAELVWPELREVQPDQAAPGDEVEILGVGGHLYWDNECGEFWLESARDFQLFFDSEPAGSITCYANMCVTNLTVPADALSGTHVISVEGGSSLSIEVSSDSAPSEGAECPEVAIVQSLKGYELYSWQTEGTWHFSLVFGTNRLKTYEEVTSSEVRVQGIAALKTKLGLLPSGQQLFWSARRVPDMTLPPVENVLQQLAADPERVKRLVGWNWICQAIESLPAI